MHDVYAYGVIAASTLIELEDGYPAEAGYAEISKVHRSLGGEAAGGAHVLARLGVATKLCGSELGTDQGADWVVSRLVDVGVDCSEVARIPGGGVTEIVVSSSGERTILASYGRMLEDRAWSRPDRSGVRSSRIVCLDPFFGEDSELVARWCVADQIPYVTIDVPPQSPIARGAAAVIVAAEYADHRLGRTDPEDLLERYVEQCSGLIILTRGGGDVWYRRCDTEPSVLPAFEVEVRDTAGAGDSFRAGVILGILEGLTDHEIVRTAAGIAAMVCQTSPGVINSPTRVELSSFMDTQGT